ncbi:hypothetical protein DdX_07299 [Ditylenchus destructor]|uniref:Uncharacterized protein n=1 Tax=Ditylenchus destructor TaxID=166010 RepID=A0AAD4N9A4_9BILA|nr:hypothetical protein DdX_07299 [Ditylenchus destructor]
MAVYNSCFYYRVHTPSPSIDDIHALTNFSQKESHKMAAQSLASLPIMSSLTDSFNMEMENKKKKNRQILYDSAISLILPPSETCEIVPEKHQNRFIFYSTVRQPSKKMPFIKQAVNKNMGQSTYLNNSRSCGHLSKPDKGNNSRSRKLEMQNPRKLRDTSSVARLPNGRGSQMSRRHSASTADCRQDNRKPIHNSYGNSRGFGSEVRTRYNKLATLIGGFSCNKNIVVAWLVTF